MPKRCGASRGVFAVAGDRVRAHRRRRCRGGERARSTAWSSAGRRRPVPKWRNEIFDVAPRWGAPPVFRLDRGAVPFFGVRAYGVHLNGYRRGRGRARSMGRPARPDKRVAPDKLDNLVAGGIGNGHGLLETSPRRRRKRRTCRPRSSPAPCPVGAVSYRMEIRERRPRRRALRLRPRQCPPISCRATPTARSPHFELMAGRRRSSTACAATDEFKFNVNLVIIDFALRHGLVPPDDPEYLDLVTGLHRPLDVIAARSFAKARHLQHLGRRAAARAQQAQRQRPVALGEAPAGRVGEQRMMAIARRRQTEQRLQQAVDMGRGDRSSPRVTRVTPLDRVVDRDREVIARRRLLARQHDIAEGSADRRRPCRRSRRSSRAGRRARPRAPHRAAARNRAPAAILRRPLRRRRPRQVPG